MQSSKSFKDFYSSESGSLQFDFAKSADVTAMECNNPTGCACGNLKVYPCKMASWQDPTKNPISCQDLARK